MKALLLKHAAKYPYMEIQDAIKLIYQNEFGGGHMIADEKSSLLRLQKEWETLDEVSPFDMELFEDVGNGLYRLNLVPLKHTSLSLETLNRFFIYTARVAKGTLRSFEEKLETFMHCCYTSELPFSAEKAVQFITDYKKNGYPLISHSHTYRSLYKPAYRIVKKEFMTYFKLFCSIDLLSASYNPLNVAIDGNSGSGKSTLAALLAATYNCNLFHMDDFFLRPEQKNPDRKSETGGNVDYMRFKEEVVAHLNGKTSFSYQVYDCSKAALTEYVKVSPKKINIVEGVYSLHPALRDVYHLKTFLTIDPKVQSMRILQRSGPKLHQRFVTEWIPLENEYFEYMQIKSLADMVFTAAP